jgi:hypothetical protein
LSTTNNNCFFIGGHFVYLCQAELEWYESIFKRKAEIPILLKDIQTEVARISCSIIGGYEYEFKSGITIVLTYLQELTNMIQAKESILNWAFQTTIGYNLISFFIYLLPQNPNKYLLTHVTQIQEHALYTLLMPDAHWIPASAGMTSAHKSLAKLCKQRRNSANPN